MLEIVALTIILAILFDISNGWNDSANAIATVVST
ncbi:MAG TPA: inorganic phosphate transporter, partial [Candidatus Krumholzibacteria bacterium]|nr:inorganic phosphate transporter [Candidatus Krumholzibacteria bacterium]